MPKRYTPDISKEVRNTVIERTAFDTAMQAVLKAPPMPKTEISRRLKTRAAVTRRKTRPS
jgi:hypothetical protein